MDIMKGAYVTICALVLMGLFALEVVGLLYLIRTVLKTPEAYELPTGKPHVTWEVFPYKWSNLDASPSSEKRNGNTNDSELPRERIDR